MDKLERVARALCVADDKDPDGQVETGERISHGFRGSEAVMEPRWHRYRDEARRFAAAFEAMRAAELGPMAEAVPEGTLASGG